LIGFLDNFYSSPVEVALLTTLFQAVLSVGGYFFMGRVRRVARERWLDSAIHSFLFLLLAGFILWSAHVNGRVSVFPAEYFVLNKDSQGIFLYVSLLALPWQAWFHLKLKFSGFYNRIKSTRVYAYVSANLAGLSLAAGFLVLYLLFSSVLNHPIFDVDDIYFDADGLNWRMRLTTDTWQDYYQRSVHPFVILLLKPPVDLIAFFLKGNKLWAAYLFFALGGAACVYLTWMFIKSATRNSAYASLIAALLGLSASHLIFGSLIETYIILAASMLLFYVLLLKDRPLPMLVAASLATIGITYTNFAQNVIALFSAKPDIKRTFRFGVWVAVFLVLLTLLNNLLYPGAHPFFFIPSTLQAEQQNVFPFNALRVQALVRAFFFQNIAAPTPILYDKDIPFIQFRFFKPEINALSQYDLPIQDITVWVWLGLLLLAGAAFLRNIRKSQYLRLSIALMGCMLFNMVLHLRYGKELFLYSTNWTYALILWVGLAWQGWSDRRWLQALLAAFLLLLALNNGLLLLNMLNILAPQVAY
ncbi:MAG TPA: hypothetical protein PLE14_02125, partial [Anaerolineales bacterium]|nr:hypothetical protein [Anaerolineales bacterium]